MTSAAADNSVEAAVASW